MKTMSGPLWFCFGLCLLPGLISVAEAGPDLRFVAGENHEFTFDTGVLRGKLHAAGKSVGLSGVIHLPTAMRLDASMGLFSYYRFFSTNHRFGTAAWDWPSKARLTRNGSVEVTWPAAAERPFELRGTFHFVQPDLLQLDTAVTAHTNLGHFEVFLASYFTPSFTNAQLLIREDAADPKASRFLPAERTFGYWQAFPRDDAATALIQDGRWKYEPNPVDWTVVRSLAEPLGFRRAPANGLTGVLMSSRKDCFALFTPFQTEPHYSMYLSLFGRDVKSGKTARARTRLWVAVSPSDKAIVKEQQALK